MYTHTRYVSMYVNMILSTSNVGIRDGIDMYITNYPLNHTLMCNRTGYGQWVVTHLQLPLEVGIFPSSSLIPLLGAIY